MPQEKSPNQNHLRGISTGKLILKLRTVFAKMQQRHHEKKRGIRQRELAKLCFGGAVPGLEECPHLFTLAQKDQDVTREACALPICGSVGLLTVLTTPGGPSNPASWTPGAGVRQDVPVAVAGEPVVKIPRVLHCWEGLVSRFPLPEKA